jgi:SpoIID/LytB domain protein
MKKTTVVIILIFAFIIGISLPYLYHNYRPLIDKYVEGNGNPTEQVKEVNNTNQEQTGNNIEEKKEIDSASYFAKAQDLFYEGNYSSSMDTYLELYNLGYDGLDLYKNMTIISDYLDNRPKELDYVLDNAYNRYNDNVEYNYYYGKYLYENSRSDKAVDVLNHLLVLLDDNDLSSRKKALVYYYLGKLYIKRDDSDIALEFFNEGISINNQIILNYISAAKLYEEKGNFAKAIKMYQNTLDQDHSLSYLYYDLAVLYDENEEPLKAHRYWERSLNSGINVETARARIKEIEENYPQYFKDEVSEIGLKREIKWADIIEINPNEIYSEIRIGLQDNIDRIRFQSKSDFRISQNGIVLFEGEKNNQYQINYNNNSFYVLRDGNVIRRINNPEKIKISSNNENNLFALYDIKFGQNYFWAGSETRQYRGDIYLDPVTGNSLNLVNYIDLSSYLLSVIPSEMPASWPNEALKAQSVVARSYILNSLNRHKSDDYDLCATVHCIVYGGAQNEHSSTSKAAIATKNEVITHNGNIIDAVFSSNSGGYTEASENVWVNELDYLKARDTSTNNEYEFPLEPYQIEEWFTEKPSSYSDNKYTTRSSYRWIKELDIQYIEQKHGLNRISKVYVSKRTKTGTVNEVTITGVNKTITIENSSIRRALGGLKSNKFIIKNIYRDNELIDLIVFGAGWGHSVGMDQTAAAGMASEGITYDEIIKFFYPNTKIELLEK